MAFKKVTNSKSDAMYIIGVSDKNRYPVNFEYRVGRTIYTIKEDVTKDAGSEMRRVVTSDGGVEIMTLESIDLDLKESDAQVLNSGITAELTSIEKATPEQIAEGTVVKAVKKETKEEPKQEEEKSEYDGIEW